MPTIQRPAPMFIGESAALDFLNSIAEPRSTEFEWLESGSDLLNWLVQSGLCADSELEHLRAPAHQANLDEVTESTREFREEFRDFVSTASDTSVVSPEHPMIDKINHFLAQGSQRLKIEVATGEQGNPSGETESVTLVSSHVYQTPHDLLPRIAAACAHLIAEADFRYVRNCEGPTCTMYFLDVSKNHKRRWCTMEVCGNRAKAAAYRKR